MKKKKLLLVTFLSTSLLMACNKNIVGLEKVKKIQEEIEGEGELLALKENLKSLGINFKFNQVLKSETKVDERLEELIRSSIDYREEDGEVRYFYNYVDLDGDGKDEVFVYLVGQSVAGSGGGTGLIIASNGELLQKISLVNTPVIISKAESMGLRNIIMPVYGGGADPFLAELKYRGKNYDSNPSMAEKLEVKDLEADVIIVDDIEFGQGILLK